MPNDYVVVVSFTVQAHSQEDAKITGQQTIDEAISALEQRYDEASDEFCAEAAQSLRTAEINSSDEIIPVI